MTEENLDLHKSNDRMEQILTRWRLLDTPPMPAADNMALMDVLLDQKGKGKSPNTIHFLQFSPPAVLVGYHQCVDIEVCRAFCRQRGIDINRRITGGGAILMDDTQIGWEVVCDKSVYDVKIPNNRLYRTLCTAMVTALGRFGIKASYRPRNDIEVNGRKISGTGGTDSEEAFLFHGTILVDFDVDLMLHCLNIPLEKLEGKEIRSLKDRVTWIKREIGYAPPPEDIKAAIAAGCEDAFGIRLEYGGLTAAENRLFEKKRDDFRSDNWIDLIQPKSTSKEVFHALNRTPSGLVRFTLETDPARRRIRTIYITGDFFSFPSRALFDLESELRGKRLDRENLHRWIQTYFEDGKIHVQGMTSRQFLAPLDMILDDIENHLPRKSFDKKHARDGSNPFDERFQSDT